MKKDQYIPHEVSMRNTTEVMNLIENEGMAGYGIYWALLEYLRTQDDYVGDLRVLKSLARQLKTKLAKIESVLNSYGLFSVTDYTFRSRKLESAMKPLEEKRKAMSKQNAGKAEANRKQNEVKTDAERNQVPCNSLKTNSEMVLSKVKESKVKKSKEITSSLSPSLPAWERYVDELQQEEQWKELMAMRTGLKQQFYTLYPRIAENFKQHVRLLGNEGRILSPSDAKHYFCFFLEPGSVTFKRLVAELQKPVDKGKYKFEDRNPVTGQRSYCGVSIPADAPPRPNEQAVWNGGKWVY
jgi:uncharacterized protein YdaU (DUF1376 family)